MKKGNPIRATHCQHGFTMIEMVITMTIVAVLASIAVPSMRTYVLNTRLTSESQELVRSFQTARSEATKRQRNVVVCASANPTAGSNAACTTGTPTGWIVFEDTNANWDRDTGTASENPIEAHAFDSSKMYLLADKSKRVAFLASGFASPAGTTAATQTPSTVAVMCDSRGNKDSNGTTTGTQSVAKGIFIASTGRVRITKVMSDITTMLNSSNINSSCPP